MIIRITNHIKLAFVALLRVAFSSQYVPQQYKYSTDEKESKLQIYRAFTKRVFSPPALVVEAEATDAHVELLGVQENLVVEENSNIVGGLCYVPVKISIYALSTTDRENLTDLVITFVRFLFRKKLQETGIVYSKITTGGETTEDWMGQILYKSTVTVNCTAETSTELPQEFVDFINKFNLTIAIEQLKLEF